MNPRRSALIALVTTLALATHARGQEPGTQYKRRWVYAAQNLLVDQNVDQVVKLIQRSGQAGYNGILLADYKFNILDRMPPNYFRNAERVKQAARQAGLEVIPALFPIGYSEGLLAHDANLAEGFPVVAAPFVAQGRELKPVLDPTAQLANGGLEETSGDTFVGFSFQDDPGKASFADHSVAHGGHVSCRTEDVGRKSSSGNCRLVQRVKVRPHACYRFSCWMKTKGLQNAGDVHLLALGAEGGRQLTFHEAGLSATQDWTLVDVVFNSLDQREVNLYAGVWGGKTGALWIDDLKLEELSLVNVLRRDGCPFVVSSADGAVRYEEGRDFEPVHDSKLGVVPFAGLYDFAHEGPRIRLSKNSRIREGAKVQVSWYHPVLTHGSQMMCCLSEPKVYELLRDQARRTLELFRPKTVLMSHDEIRVANWCQACQARKLTPGALLADNAWRCAAILKELDPQLTVAVWSDMFDPNHNAVSSYYLVNGSLEGSWNGLSPNVVIANWNSGKARPSLEFFARRGHRQILAGYYDADDLGNFRTWDDAARGVPRVEGFMYTTWQNRYDLLAEYGKALLKTQKR